MDKPRIARLNYTVREAEYRLNVSHTKIYELFKTGELQPIKIGTKTLVPESELDAYVARLQEKSKHPSVDPSTSTPSPPKALNQNHKKALAARWPNHRKGKNPMDLQLGCTAHDKITGFQGVVTGICEYISGCNQALLVPKVDKEGKHVDGQWYDVQRLVVHDDEVITLDNGETPGCDMPAPKR